jgi:hypothetical protein
MNVAQLGLSESTPENLVILGQPDVVEALVGIGSLARIVGKA